MSVTLAQLTGPAYTRIYSYGAARGENAVPNEDLIGPIDSRTSGSVSAPAS